MNNVGYYKYTPVLTRDWKLYIRCCHYTEGSRRPSPLIYMKMGHENKILEIIHMKMLHDTTSEGLRPSSERDAGTRPLMNIGKCKKLELKKK